jgi:MFS family permease
MNNEITHEAPRSQSMNRVLFLLGFSALINYLDRSNLSIAADMIKGELHISDLQLGALLSAFFWTYALMQIPAGWLVDRLDVKWVFAGGYFVWSMATATTGVLRGFAALILIRVILGIGESVAFPSYSKILCGHFTESQRGTANGVLITGLALGPAFGMLVGGTVVGRFGWRPFFLILGAGSLLWLVPWLAWMPSRSKVAATVSGTGVRILDILRQRSAWGTCFGQFSMNYSLYFMVTWLPSYLTRGRHFSMDRMARTGGLIFLMFAISAMLAGKFSDRWITAGASVTLVRKILLGAGMAGAGFCVAAAAVSPEKIFVWMLVGLGIFLGAAGGSCWAVSQTIAGPRVAGRWTGVQNFIGNLGGAVAPLLTGYLLGRTGQFYWAFAITALVSWLGALSWVVIVGPVEPLDWAKCLQQRAFGGVDSSSAASATQAARP